MFRMWPKSGAYEVASRVESEDEYATSTEAMSRNENSDDPWLQTTAKRLKVQISNSDMWAAYVFITKPVAIDFLIFIKKIPKEIPLLNEEVSS